MDCDFLIIGGGFAGLSTGASLSQLGRVLVVEAEKALGYHASGRSAAMFEENYGQPSTIELNRASRSYHEKAGVLSPRGLMLVGKAADRDQFDADIQTMHLDVISLEEARRRLPLLSAEITRAAVHDDALDIDTDRLLQGYAKEIRANGGQIRTGFRVSDIIRTATGWQVRAGEETLSGRLLVNAAGAWADHVAKLAGCKPIGLQPLRRSVARVPAPQDHDVARWPMLFGPGESWYMKPDAGALLVSPAEEDPQPPMDAWADDMVLAEGLARFEAYVDHPVTRILANWAGLRSFAPDRNLVIGFDPDDSTFLWVAGQGGYGVQSSPAYGRLAADLVAGRTPDIAAKTVAALAPERFR